VVRLHGQVRTSPQIYFDKTGEPLRAMVIIRVLRRPTNNQGFDAKIYLDNPIIRTRNKEMIEVLSQLKANDMVDVKGVLTSKEVNKKTICPECGAEVINKGNIVYITPIFICRREIGVSDGEGMRLLKERCEVSNEVDVIGNVCREPHYYTDGNGREYAQYQLAVNRRFHIKEDADEIRTDYPWIKTFGRQALEDSKHLRIGSSVYINGALQTREIKRRSECPSCFLEYEWNDAVTEIVPYYIGYLKNCMSETDGSETSEAIETDLDMFDFDPSQSGRDPKEA